MSHAAAAVKPDHPAIAAYHAALKLLAAHGAQHESATETAFSRLLADTAKAHGWALIPKKGMTSKATKKHKRSGIKSDPNRADDPEYIVRLVGQVVKVSLETVRIVAALPKDFAGS